MATPTHLTERLKVIGDPAARGSLMKTRPALISRGGGSQAALQAKQGNPLVKHPLGANKASIGASAYSLYGCPLYKSTASYISDVKKHYSNHAH